MTVDDMMIIGKKMLEVISLNILKTYQITLSISDFKLKNIIQTGYHPEFGARNLERLIRDEVEGVVAKMILEEKVKKGETVQCT